MLSGWTDMKITYCYILLHYTDRTCRHTRHQLQLVCGRVQLPVCACKLFGVPIISVLSALSADPARVTSVNGLHRVLTGRPVTLTFNIAAIPDATVMWYKDGSPVLSGPSISTTPDTNTQLTIASATPADSGMYQCVVSNQHSDDVGSISLQVRDPRKGS